MREFIYDGRSFPDPDPKMTVDEVKQSMVDFFPELANADATTTRKGDVEMVEFKRRVGTKG
ncbi:MAG: PRTRC system protein C [Dehalococcoidales bacterium]|nr:PRTRC system protein C [Dehalococcoidales bacterium]